VSRLGSYGQRLYSGQISFDFVSRRRLWYALSALIMVVAAAGLLVRGVNQGIEFRGGVEFTAQMAPTADNVDRLIEAAEEAGVDEVTDPVVTTSGSDAIRVQTPPLSQDQATIVQEALEEAGASEVSQDLIGPTWGEQVANKALTGLLVFVGLVVLFIWAYFREWKMSLAAVVALAHDLVITVGVYAWSGFEVTPATVTGLLTILGYSLYDTVVVFDKVRENTHRFADQTRRTWGELANLAVNQTLVRSINTSITALLPVVALLIVGTVVLGTGPLKDLSLALFVGMAAGTYSSIFIATPLAAGLKERDEDVRKHTEKVLARRMRESAGQPVPAGVAPGPVAESPVRRGGASPARPAGGPTQPTTTPLRGGASPARPAGGATAAVADSASAPDSPPDAPAAAPSAPRSPRMTPSGSSRRIQPQRGTRSSRGKGRR
jgi:preprotein translocase subunit SecF